MLSGQCAGSLPGGKRETKYLREPSDSTLSCTNLFSPEMIAAMEITDETPMTMPITVSAERTLDERSASRAEKKFSRAWCKVMIAIIQTSWRSPDPGARLGGPGRF